MIVGRYITVSDKEKSVSYEANKIRTTIKYSKSIFQSESSVPSDIAYEMRQASNSWGRHVLKADIFSMEGVQHYSLYIAFHIHLVKESLIQELIVIFSQQWGPSKSFEPNFFSVFLV